MPVCQPTPRCHCPLLAPQPAGGYPPQGGQSYGAPKYPQQGYGSQVSTHSVLAIDQCNVAGEQ